MKQLAKQCAVKLRKSEETIIENVTEKPLFELKLSKKNRETHYY